MKNWRLNFFDVALIVVVLAAAALFLMLSGRTGIPGTTTPSTVQYEIELTNLPPEALDKVSVGDSITDKVEKHVMGNVVSFNSEPFKISSRNTVTGNYELQEVPGRYSLKLTLESPAVESATNFTIDGALIVRCGTEISVLGPGYGGVGYITDVTRED